jgi:hypothetical protein
VNKTEIRTDRLAANIQPTLSSKPMLASLYG